MHLLRLLLLLSILPLVGCVSRGEAYARQHPGLTEKQRQILSTGQMITGDAVAGMTHDEIKLAMHGFPTTYNKINGEEAWVYVRKKSVAPGFPEDRQSAMRTGFDRPEAFSASENAGPSLDVNIRTTVLFQGDKATHADVSEEPSR